MKHNNKESIGSSIIKVIGVGGGGGNAVNHMFKQGIVGVDFAVCNTDRQVLEVSPVPVKIQLGPSLTEGRGAGSKPIIGKEACLESIEDIRTFLADDTKMLFITAGMGGGTGTGAAPVIAQAAQEMDILTVAIVTLPFQFEGRTRSTHAFEGLNELKKNVDTIIVISNDKLRHIHGNLSLSQAFMNADDVLTTAAKGIAEIITVPGYVNVDFEDVNTVMRGSGVAVMGTASMEGPERARRAVEAALQSPLLEDNDIRGAQNILLNITSGKVEVTMDEVWEITEFVQEAAGDANLIWGNCYDEALGEKLSVTVIATGFETGKKKLFSQGSNQQKAPDTKQQAPAVKRVHLDDDITSPSRNEPKKDSGNIYEFSNSKDSGKSFSFEFDAPAPGREVRKSYFPEENLEPYVKEEDPETLRMKKEEERRARLRNLSMKFDNPNVINELENEPAYLRRQVKLEDIPHSSESNTSKYTLNVDDEGPKIRDNNPFLHDNAD